jgi:DNA-binding transcriptional ArsR family regulator
VTASRKPYPHAYAYTPGKSERGRVHKYKDSARVLRLLRRLDEGATVEQLARHLYRQPPHPPIIGSYAQKIAIRRAWQDACRSAEVAAHASISRTLRRLTRSGYVDQIGAPRVAAWVTETQAQGRLSSEQRLMARIVTESPPTRAALGLSGSGERAYDRLVADGYIVAPSVRRLSAKGLELLIEWEST